MKKKQKGIILRVIILGMLLSVSAGAAETGGEFDLPKGETATITADYSALDYGDQEIAVIDQMRAYSDAACENELDLQTDFSDEEKLVYRLEEEDIPEMIYLIPPIISVSQKVEKTELYMQDEEDASDAGFWIKDVFVQKVRRGLFRKEPAVYEVNVIIDSETGEYPDHLKMVSDGKIYSEMQSVSFSGPDPAKQALSEYSFHYEVSDDADAALKILDRASFVYYRTVRFETANDWDFSCKDAKLQIIAPAIDG